MVNPPYFDDAARERQKKSTMACEMCRKRKVKCIFKDPSQVTCNFCAKYSFQCIVNTARKRRGPRPRKMAKPAKNEPHYRSPTHGMEDEFQQVSTSSGISDHEDVDSPPVARGKDNEENAFIGFLGELSTIEFDLPIGVNEAPEVVRHCLSMFFTHINFQQCEFLNGPAFLEDLKAGTVQPCLINAICAVSARFSIHPSLITQPRYLAGSGFARAARDQCQLDRPIFRLYIIQTLAILALYSFSINEGAHTWFYLGAANRIAQIISLKVDPDTARPPGIAEVSHRELEAFLQIAKTLYVMERLMISGTPSRPVMIADMDFFQDPLDSKEEETTTLQNIGSPVEDPARFTDESPHIIQLLSIWEHISLFEREGFVNLDPPPWKSFSRFQELRQMLDDWMLRLPKDLQFSSETLALRLSVGKGAQLVFLHCLYHHCNIILNRVFLPILPWQQEFRGAPIFFLRERQNKCINSAASISIIIAEAFRSKSFIMPPFMGYCVFQSSIVHIHQSFCTSGEAAVEVKRDLKTNLQVLIIIKEFYRPAETWCHTIREMYEVHLERQTRVCPVGVASLTRQFRRYFDRFEGRIREPPFAVYDDLAYTQGEPPTKFPSPQLERDLGNVGAMVTGPNLEEYRERLRGFAMDLGKEEDEMHDVFSSNDQNQQIDLGDLYTFPMTMLPDEPSSSSGNYANTIQTPVFSTLDPFNAIPDQSFPSTSAPTQVLSPFDLGSINTSSSQHSAPAVTEEQDSGDLFLFDDTDFGFENWEDVFGDMPDMPGLDGVIDQGFLTFLDSQQ